MRVPDLRASMNGRVLSVALLLIGCTSGSSGNGKCEDLPSSPVSAQALGEPCATKADCTAGLICGALYFGSGAVQQNACTLDCSAAACPAGSACVDGQETLPTDGGSRRTRFCVPTCASDADCQHGTRAGTCSAPPDGGTAQICAPLTCTAGKCPSAYGCTDVLCPPPGSAAPFSPGWCRKLPQ